MPGIVAYSIGQSGTERNSSETTGYESYINMPGGMYAYYGNQPGMALPKSNEPGAGRSLSLEELRGSALPIPLPLLGEGTSETDYYVPAPLVLPYPQEVGHRWLVGDTMRFIEGKFWVDKEIAGWETVTTPAGTFEGARLNWVYQWPYEGTTEESCVMTPVGMVLRTATYFGLEVTDYSNPYGTGETMDVYLKYELVSYTLN